jgi:hypothetical protein
MAVCSAWLQLASACAEFKQPVKHATRVNTEAGRLSSVLGVCSSKDPILSIPHAKAAGPTAGRCTLASVLDAICGGMRPEAVQ